MSFTNPSNLTAPGDSGGDYLPLTGGTVTGATTFGGTALDGGWTFGFTGSASSLFQVKSSSAIGAESGLKCTGSGGKEFRTVSTGSSYWSSNLPAGVYGITEGIVPRFFVSSTHVAMKAGTSAITSGDLFNSSVSLHLDESGSNLIFTCKKSDGTVLTGTLAIS